MRNYIALAVPFFFVLIAIEVFVARRKGVPTYRFNDMLTNLACGTSQQLTAIFIAASMVALPLELALLWTARGAAGRAIAEKAWKTRERA